MDNILFEAHEQIAQKSNAIVDVKAAVKDDGTRSLPSIELSEQFYLFVHFI